MKKSPSHFRHKKPSPTSKIKLICSFNGAFQPKPPSGTLRYVGGETRIISVDRNTGFSQLVSKISELCPTTPPFSVKYHLPGSDRSNENEPPLVSMITDEDVRYMIEEYDKVESDCGKKKNKKHTRLWVFVCTSSTVDNKSNWYVGLGPHHHDFSVSDLGILSNSYEQSKIAKPHIVGMCKCEDSLRKPVFKQDESANRSVGCENSPCLEYKSMFTCDSGTPRSYNPLRESVSVPRIQTVQTHFLGNQNLENLVQFNHCGDLRVGADLSIGYGGGGNVACYSPIATMPYINAVPMSSGMNLNCGWRNSEEVKSNSGNVMPQAAYCDPVFGSFSNKADNTLLFRSQTHRNGGFDMRNQQISPYHGRSHRSNLPEVGNYRGVGIDGKTCSGKCCNGLRPSSNIFKHGQAMRSNYTHLWKPWSSIHDNTWEGMARMVEPAKPTQSFINVYDSNHASAQGIDHKTNGRCAVDDLIRQDGHLVEGFGISSPHADHLGCHSMAYSLPLSSNFANSHSTNFRPVNTLEDLLSYQNYAKSRIESGCMMKNVQGTPEASSYDPLNGNSIYPDLNSEPSFLASQTDVDFPDFSMGTEYVTEDDVDYDIIFPKFNQNEQVDTKQAAKTLRDDHNGVGALSGVVTLDLSLHKLSLSSSKSARAPTSSLASNDISKSLPVDEMGAQQNLLDLMDEGHFSSAPRVEKSSGDTSSFSVESAAVLRKNLSQKDNSQGSPFSLGVDETADGNGSLTCLKVGGGIYSDHVALYSQLATPELQTIKNSDLEDIRELGSGTYGTVYYGKWKGSDVAIKRIKPSCFSGSKLEEDRLIADFWTEAHILGQLHHPNVVSFFGVVKDGTATNLATVTEYMVNGSLKQVLQRKDRTIDRRKRLLIAMDAAIGMEYLHEKNIVHFDLKSHNFLVNMRDPYRPVCKIGDMGLSKVKRKTLVSGGIRGTIPWMAPELLTSENNMVTEKVDVYSFGIVMWELLTGEEPYAHLPSEETIGGIISGELRPEVPSWCDPMWRSLMERCWSSDPGSRPSFSEIAKELRSVVEAMNIK